MIFQPGSPTLFQCADIGPNSVTLTVFDSIGNPDMCSAIITVLDILPPVPACKNVTSYLSGAGTATINTFNVDDGSSDNCIIQSTTLDLTFFTCNEEGPNDVVLTLTDLAGNSSTCDATAFIFDTISPVAICKDLTLYLDANGNATTLPSAIDNGSSDNCSSLILSLSDSTFNCSNLGDNIIDFIASDSSGNSAICLTTITVLDTIAPTVFCTNVTAYLDSDGNISISENYVSAGSYDSCGIVSTNLSKPNFTCIDVGANTISVVVTDASGNSASCFADVFILDTIRPEANCYDITAYLDATGNITIQTSDVNNGSSDACGIEILSIDVNSFTCNEIGINDVLLTVTDSNGNSRFCTSVVTVFDTVLPTVICQNVTAYLDGSGNATIDPATIDNGSSDACGISSISLSQSNFNCDDSGVNNVFFFVNDNNANVDSCSVQITIVDSIRPTTSCQNITVNLDINGDITVNPNDLDNNSFDACGIANFTLSTNIFNCNNIGDNNVTLTVTDINGNSSTCSAIITVNDLVSPVANCQDITAFLDASGNISILASVVDNSSSDACGISSISLSQLDFDCNSVGADSVTLSVFDVNSNEGTCNANVLIVDNIAPIAICQDITITLDGNGTATVNPALVDNGSSDICGIDNLTLSQTIFDCDEVGVSVITFTVSDLSGNTATCNAQVTIEPFDVTQTDISICDGEQYIIYPDFIAGEAIDINT